MKFTTQANANMTCLQGYVETTFAELVACFGPSEGSGDKVTQNWALEFEDGTVATIYDWKTNMTIHGPYHWHIGGHSNLAVGQVRQALMDHQAQ
jgi:hypothetical protein